MKALLAGAAMASLAALPAVAADMAVKAPPAPVPVSTWTGFYVGANLGGAWQHADPAVSAAGGPFAAGLFTPAFAAGAIPSGFSQDMSGIVGGLTTGYNVQSGSFVFGVEGDVMGTDLSAANTVSLTVAPFPTITTSVSTKTDWLVTFRGRLGMLAFQDTLLYVTGGLALGQVEGSASVIPNSATSTCANNLFCSLGSGSGTRTGWTAGVGAEHKFGPHLTAKIEYLHYDLGTFSYTANEAVAGTPPVFAGPTVNVNTPITGDIVRAGVNWLF
jgi:outer membrane immunogenic protein